MECDKVCEICYETNITNGYFLSCYQCSKSTCLRCVYQLKKLECPYCRAVNLFPSLIEHDMRICSFQEFTNKYYKRQQDLYHYQSKGRNFLMMACEYRRVDLVYWYTSYFAFHPEYSDMFSFSCGGEYIINYVVKYVPQLFYQVLSCCWDLDDEVLEKVSLQCIRQGFFEYALFILQIYEVSTHIGSMSPEDLSHYMNFLRYVREKALSPPPAFIMCYTS